MWNSNEASSGDNKISESNISHISFSEMQEPIVRKTSSHTYIAPDIYIPQLFFAESWLNFHIPLHALYLAGKKDKEVYGVISIVV